MLIIFFNNASIIDSPTALRGSHIDIFILLELELNITTRPYCVFSVNSASIMLLLKSSIIYICSKNCRTNSLH